MAIENANSHPYKVAITKESGVMYANSHPYQVVIVGGGGGQEGRVVDELPEVGEPGYIYLVLKEESEEGNIYDEYMWVLQQDGETYGWEHIATTDEVEVPAVVQTTGTSTEDVMSQNATTSMVFADPANRQKVQIGNGALNTSNTGIAIGNDSRVNAAGFSGIAIGGGATAGPQCVTMGYNAGWWVANGTINIGESAKPSNSAQHGIAIGTYAYNGGAHSIALGAYSKTSVQGQMDISTSYTNNTYGYNSSQYRLLTGLYDPQSDHDAATKGYVDATTASAGTAFTNAEFNSIFDTSLTEEA